MKLIPMKRDPQDDAEAPDAVALDGATYPAGLRLHVDHPTMAKLGIKETPRPGAVYRIEGHAKVTDAHEPADGAKDGRSVALHFTHMAAAPRDDAKSLRQEIEDAAQRSAAGAGATPQGNAADDGDDAQ